jgi:hypothetical protein
MILVRTDHPCLWVGRHSCLPDQGASKADRIYRNMYMHHNMTHIHKIHNIGYDKFKTSSQQVKQLLWCLVVATGSSHRVEEAIDKVVSLPASL